VRSCSGGSLVRVRTFVVTVAVVALAGGCAGYGDSEESDDRQGLGTFDQSTPSGPGTTGAPPPRSEEPAVIDSEACEEVRIGIEAFNVGEFDETVAHFEEALPLAEEQDDGSAVAGQLVEAVRYYAELDAEDYPKASRSSPEFAKYKAITLGQCVSGVVEVPESSESPGVEI